MKTSYELELYRAHTPRALQRRCQSVSMVDRSDQSAKELDDAKHPVDDLYLHIVPGCAHEQRAHGGQCPP